jgi:hypothetical protein
MKVNLLDNIKEQIPGYAGIRKNERTIDRDLPDKFLSPREFNFNHYKKQN